MSAVFGVFRQIKQDDNLGPGSLVPILILVIYSGVGAVIIYFLERGDEECGFENYWTALYFVNTVYTTIGYGNRFPCSIGGKVFTILFSFVGIPLCLVVLDTIGQLMAAVANGIWSELYCCCCCFVICCRRIKAKRARKRAVRERKKAREEAREAKQQETIKKNSVAPLTENAEVIDVKPAAAAAAVDGGEPEQTFEEVTIEEQELELEVKEFNALGKRNVSLPVWIGFLMVIIWICVSAAFFSYTEGWWYLDGVYFMFVSVTTVGFGDFAPVKWEVSAALIRLIVNHFAIAQFFFIFVGLSLFSLCIALVQQSLERLQDQIQENIFEAYKASLESGNMQDGLTVEEMVRKEGGAQRFLLSKKAMKELQKEYDKAAGMQTVGTNTPHKTYRDNGTIVKETMFRRQFDPTFNPVRRQPDGRVLPDVPDDRGKPVKKKVLTDQY